MVRESGLSRYSHGQRDLRSRAILSERSEQGGDTAFTSASLLCNPLKMLDVSADILSNLRFLVCERDASRLVNAARFSDLLRVLTRVPPRMTSTGVEEYDEVLETRSTHTSPSWC